MACANTIQKGINGICDSTVGGVKWVLIGNYKEGAATITENKVSALAITGDWYKFTFRKSAANMNSTLNIDEANGVNAVTTDLQMTFAKMDTNKRVTLAALSTSELMAVVADANGKYWLLGASEPVVVSAGSGTTGAARTDSNNYSVTLQDYFETFPYEVDATLAKSLYEDAKD